MNTITLLLFIFLIPQAFAGNHIGHWANYKISISHSDGRNEEFTQKREVIAFNESNGVYLVKQTDRSPVIGEIEYYVEYPGYMSPEEGKLVVQNCVAENGKFIQIAIAASRIDACKFTNDSGDTTVLGGVSFGLIEANSLDEEGTLKRTVLLSFGNH
jgi:hypothetical protein